MELERSRDRAVEDYLDAMEIDSSEMSSESAVEKMSEKSDSVDSDTLLTMALDDRAVKVVIPDYVGDLVSSKSHTVGINSFTQVKPEPALSEYVVFLERLLNVLADYGKLFIRRRFRFEFGKLLTQFKLLISEKLESVVLEFIDLANRLFAEFSIENQTAYMYFLHR